MTCYNPIKAYRSETLNANGKRPLVFDEHKGIGPCLDIPCGQCIGCRLDRSLDWAVRISCEASLYKQNCFITLTYAPENLPLGGSLCLAHFQLFMKRLRSKYGKNIRFFHCGEYGEKLGRPHYHACLLNFDFADKLYHRSTARGDKIYRSASLEQLWPYGLSEIGDVTFESAAYVARYVTKKVTGKLAPDHYAIEPVIDESTGEIVDSKRPEYTTMSRRPGIGAPWLEKFHADVYSHDYFVTRSGAKMKPPRFFDNRYELMNPEHFSRISENREFSDVNTPGTYENRRRALDSTPERLKVRETVHRATVSKTLKRQYEE